MRKRIIFLMFVIFYFLSSKSPSASEEAVQKVGLVTEKNEDYSSFDRSKSYLFKFAQSHNVGAVEIVSPKGDIPPLTQIVVKAKYKNFGETQENFKIYFSIIYKHTDSLVYIDSATLTLLSQQETLFCFSKTFSPAFNFLGSYKTYAWTSLPEDSFPENDTVKDSFRITYQQAGWHMVGYVEGASKSVKSGAALCSWKNRVYAIVGNNTRELLVFDIGKFFWIKLSEMIPLGDKNIGKGASICTDGNYVYIIKGNNTKEFWRYDLIRKIWIPPLEIPFSKKIKGSSMTWDGDSFIYIISGSNNREWVRFNRYTQTFVSCFPESLPSGKWKLGSWIVYVPGEVPTIYGLRVGGKENEFYCLPIGDTFQRKASMPLIGSTGKSKKAKEGSAGAYNPEDRRIYALKGGGTKEFFCYDPQVNEWISLDTIGRKVKGGGALTYSSDLGGFFAFVGGGSDQFWFYRSPHFPLAKTKYLREDDKKESAQSKKNPLKIISTRDYFKIFHTSLTKTRTKLEMYDILGKLIYTTFSDEGFLLINRKDFVPGVYIIKLMANEYQALQKIVIP